MNAAEWRSCVTGWRKKGPTASHCADHPPREGGGGPARGPVDTHAACISWRKVRRWPVLISGSRVRACFHSSRLPGLGGLSPLVRAHAPRISLRIHHQGSALPRSQPRPEAFTFRRSLDGPAPRWSSSPASGAGVADHYLHLVLIPLSRRQLIAYESAHLPLGGRSAACGS